MTQERLVDVSEVESGAACNCICFSCEIPLEARKGAKNVHHFGHIRQLKEDLNNVECQFSLDVSLRMMLRQIFRETTTVLLPDYILNNINHDDHLVVRSCKYEYHECKTDIFLDDVQGSFDAKLSSEAGELLIFVSYEGREVPFLPEASHLGLIEIDIRQYLKSKNEGSYVASLNSLVSEQSLAKKWIFHKDETAIRRKAKSKRATSTSKTHLTKSGFDRETTLPAEIKQLLGAIKKNHSEVQNLNDKHSLNEILMFSLTNLMKLDGKNFQSNNYESVLRIPLERLKKAVDSRLKVNMPLTEPHPGHCYIEESQTVRPSNNYAMVEAWANRVSTIKNINLELERQYSKMLNICQKGQNINLERYVMASLGKALVHYHWGLDEEITELSIKTDNQFEKIAVYSGYLKEINESNCLRQNAVNAYIEDLIYKQKEPLIHKLDQIYDEVSGFNGRRLARQWEYHLTWLTDLSKKSKPANTIENQWVSDIQTRLDKLRFAYKEFLASLTN